MLSTHDSVAKVVHPPVAWSAADMVRLLDVKDRQIAHLRRQVAWFQRQIFGQKSERRPPEPECMQGTLGESFEIVPADLPPVTKSKIAPHEREHKHKNQIDSGVESALVFDGAKVPVKVIAVPNPAGAGLNPCRL